MLTLILVPLFIALAAIVCVRRRLLAGQGVLMVLSAPGVIAFLVLVPRFLAQIAFGEELVRLFVSRSRVAEVGIVMGLGLGFFAPLSTLMAFLMALRAPELSPFATVLVVVSVLGAVAYWTFFIYFMTHFGI